MLTFRRLGFNDLTSDQNDFLTKFVQMDEPQEGFFQFVAKSIINVLGHDEAAKFNAIILQKHFEFLQNLTGVFHPKSFAYQLTSALLTEVSFSTEKNTQEIFKLLENLTPTQKLDETLRARKLSNEEKVADMYKTKSTSELKLEDKLKALFYTIPKCVVPMFLPLFHSVIEKLSPKKGKIVFSDAFFEHFFRVPMLDSPKEENLTKERKVVLIAKAQTINPFYALVEALDDANKQYTPTKMNSQAVTVVQSLVEACMSLFQLKATIQQISAIIEKFQAGFKRETQTSWFAVYQRVLKTLKELDQKLIESNTKLTPEQIKLLITQSEEMIHNLLLIIIKDPLPDLTPLLDLDKELTPIQSRIVAVTEILSIVEKMFEENSPVMRSYRDAAANLRTLFEECAVPLVHNVVNTNKADKEEIILNLEIQITKIVAPIMLEVIDEQTLLHRLLTSTNENKQALQEQLECVLREGADLKATTTKYERKGTGLKGLMTKFLPGKNAPLDAEGLAELYGNSEVLSLAQEKVEAERQSKDRKSTDKLQAFIAGALENTKRNSLSKEPQKMEEVPLPAPPLSTSWVRADKRERTPGNTPRNSDDGHTDKKRKAVLH